MLIIDVPFIVGKRWAESHDLLVEFLEQNDIVPLAHTNSQLILADEAAVVYRLKGLEQAFEQMYNLEETPF